MARVFFKLGTYDLTPYLDINGFDINVVEEYQEWKDGNYRIHREVERSRRQGKIAVGFKTESDYNTFLTNLTSQKDTGGTYSNFRGFYNIESWICNAGTATGTQTYRAYVEPIGSAKWDLVNGRQWITQTLSVMEL